MAETNEQACDECEEPAFQVVADATKDPVQYRRLCKAHMKPEGPFPIDEPTQEQIDELRTALEPVEVKCPEGWKKRRDTPGVYTKKKLRIVMTGRGEVTISISVNRHGYPCHPTDDQCQQVLQAFGFENVKEVPRTTTARYFKY